MTSADVDAYVADFSEPVRALIEEIRAIARQALPGSEEVISYKIGAVRAEKRNIIYFAGYKGHAGLYPAPLDDPDLAALLAPYASGKASLRFKPGKPVPQDVVRAVIAFNLARAQAGKG